MNIYKRINKSKYITNIIKQFSETCNLKNINLLLSKKFENQRGEKLNLITNKNVNKITFSTLWSDFTHLTIYSNIKDVSNESNDKDENVKNNNSNNLADINDLENIVFQNPEHFLSKETRYKFDELFKITDIKSYNNINDLKNIQINKNTLLELNNNINNCAIVVRTPEEYDINLKTHAKIVNIQSLEYSKLSSIDEVSITQYINDNTYSDTRNENNVLYSFKARKIQTKFFNYVCCLSKSYKNCNNELHYTNSFIISSSIEAYNFNFSVLPIFSNFRIKKLGIVEKGLIHISRGTLNISTIYGNNLEIISDLNCQIQSNNINLEGKLIVNICSGEIVIDSLESKSFDLFIGNNSDVKIFVKSIKEDSFIYIDNLNNNLTNICIYISEDNALNSFKIEENNNILYKPFEELEKLPTIFIKSKNNYKHNNIIIKKTTSWDYLKEKITKKLNNKL